MKTFWWQKNTLIPIIIVSVGVFVLLKYSEPKHVTMMIMFFSSGLGIIVLLYLTEKIYFLLNKNRFRRGKRLKGKRKTKGGKKNE